MSRKDYVPESARYLRDWTDNYISELPAIATRINWPTANVTRITGNLTSLKTAAQAVLDKQNELDQALGQLALAKSTSLPGIRQDTANLKTTSGFTEGDGRTLDVISPADSFDPNTYQPRLDARAKLGHVELMGKKLGADSLNLYMRRKGEANWTLILVKRSRFPVNDDVPLLTPGRPEEREYQAIGVLNDEEIGLPSDIVSAVFTG